MTPVEFLQILYDTEFGTSLRESLYMFPLVEGTHLIGLSVSVGLILLTDLRLIGVFLPKVPVQDILHQLRPWVLGGFAVTFLTGFLLLWAEGARIYLIPVFPLKLLFIFIAGLNALWFELKYGRHVSTWGVLAVLPKGARLAGWASLVTWGAVIICGRLIPYLDTAH